MIDMPVSRCLRSLAARRSSEQIEKILALADTELRDLTDSECGKVEELLHQIRTNSA